MVQYLITYQGDTIVLENVASDATEKNSVQLTSAEFCIFMQYPSLSKDEIYEKLWEVCDQTQGRIALASTVEKAFAIMGRE